MFMAPGCAQVAIYSYTSTVCEIIQNNMKNKLAVSHPRHVMTGDYFGRLNFFCFEKILLTSRSILFVGTRFINGSPLLLCS